MHVVYDLCSYPDTGREGSCVAQVDRMRSNLFSRVTRQGWSESACFILMEPCATLHFQDIILIWRNSVGVMDCRNYEPEPDILILTDDSQLPCGSS